MEITEYSSFEQIDKKCLVDLIESGFGKKLAEDYFEYVHPSKIIVAGDYSGLMLLEKIHGDIYYLDKFVVKKEFQSNRIGRLLWNKIAESKVLWRARIDNQVSAFYSKACHRNYICDSWNIYGINLSEEEFEHYLNYALSKKPTLF